ncbi:MAG TPA: magnesium transporter CorA family protein [Gaiellaceae bacterium]|nr:magnesium transporter CorA family protein [Gaiellaceae bacterium]
MATPAGSTTAAEPRLAELESDGLTWIHLERPTHDEVSALAERFGWHPLDVEDVLSRRERPKVDQYTEAEGGGYLFAVLHFPVYDASVGRLNAGELDVFVGPNYVVTLPMVELRPVSRLFQRVTDNDELRHNLFSRGSGRLLYEILDDLYDYCFPILDKIGFKLGQIDEAIDDVAPRAKERVRDIHKVKQEIISYRKIVRPQRPTIRQLERGVERFLPEELELYFDDIVDASERIWDLLDNYKEVVEALEDTNESLISHQQNDILYVLTIFSVVMLPLTVITGFFGQNVNFPGFDSTGGFVAMIVISAITVIGMLGFFRYKRWL